MLVAIKGHTQCVAQSVAGGWRNSEAGAGAGAGPGTTTSVMPIPAPHTPPVQGDTVTREEERELVSFMFIF